MFQKTRRGWAIAVASWKVLLRHPNLFVLPLASTLALVGLIVLIGDAMFAGERAQFGWLFFAIGFFLLYLLLAFVSIFFNAALVFCVLDAFAGRAPSVRAGIAAAVRRLPQIVSWVLFATTVGLAIGMVQGLLRRLGPLGALAGSATGVAWSVAITFVVPVLVADGVGPREAMERSIAVVRKGWGESLGISFGIVLLFVAGLVPPILLIAWINGGGVAPAMHDRALIAAGVASGIYLAALLSLTKALGSIFSTGIYLYATTGQVPKLMDRSLIEAR